MYFECDCVMIIVLENINIMEENLRFSPNQSISGPSFGVILQNLFFQVVLWENSLICVGFV